MKDKPLPDFIINHGVLSEVKLKRLLREAKVCTIYACLVN